MYNTPYKRIEETEVAKIVRGVLKNNFPGTKFSVKTHKYAGGSNIWVSWIDGPSDAAVRAVIGDYKGASYDSDNDFQDYHTCLYNGEEVRFANDYISTSRTLSQEALKQGVEWAEKEGYDITGIKVIQAYTIGKCTITAHLESEYVSLDDTRDRINHYLRNKSL